MVIGQAYKAAEVLGRNVEYKSLTPNRFFIVAVQSSNCLVERLKVATSILLIWTERARE